MSRLVPVPFLLALLVLACDSSTPGPGQLRVANLIPDNVSLDVCLKPDTAGAYGSPLVGGSGLFYPQLSERSAFDAGTYSVRFVPAGSTGCAGSLNGLGDRSLTIAADFPQTLVLTGRLSGTGSPFVDVSVTQDRTAAAPTGSVLLRALNAAPGSNAQDVGLTSALFQPFITNVGYGTASNYQSLNVNPNSTGVAAALTSRDIGTGLLWASGTFNNVADTGVFTLFVIGIPGQTGPSRPSMMLCAEAGINCAQSP